MMDLPSNDELEHKAYALSRALLKSLRDGPSPENYAAADRLLAEEAKRPPSPPPTGGRLVVRRVIPPAPNDSHTRRDPMAEDQPKKQTYPGITDEDWEAQQIRDEQGRLTHTPEGKPLKVPYPPGGRFKPRRDFIPRTAPRRYAKDPALSPEEIAFLDDRARAWGQEQVDHDYHRWLEQAKQVGELD